MMSVEIKIEFMGRTTEQMGIRTQLLEKVIEFVEIKTECGEMVMD